MSDHEVNFDDYTDNYEELLNKQLSFFNSASDYFASYKIELLRRNLSFKPQKILDFGCGIGLSLSHLLKAFPNADIYGSDISKKSLSIVRKNYPKVTAIDDLNEYQDYFDLIFLAGVIHHISPSKRSKVIQQIQSLLKPGGEVSVFEHNPYNPITRRIVSNCPFDKGVVLIHQRELKELMKGGGLRPTKSAYCLFFPELFQAFRHFEKFLERIPLGGQYFVLSNRPYEQS